MLKIQGFNPQGGGGGGVKGGATLNSKPQTNSTFTSCDFDDDKGRSVMVHEERTLGVYESIQGTLNIDTQIVEFPYDKDPSMAVGANSVEKVLTSLNR